MQIIRDTKLFNELSNTENVEAIKRMNRRMKYILTGPMTRIKKGKLSIVFFTNEQPIVKIMKKLNKPVYFTAIRCQAHKKKAYVNKAKEENITHTELIQRALDKYCGIE